MRVENILYICLTTSKIKNSEPKITSNIFLFFLSCLADFECSECADRQLNENAALY